MDAPIFILDNNLLVSFFASSATTIKNFYITRMKKNKNAIQ